MVIIKINDIEVNYTEHGKGKELILLHGWGQSSNTFNSLVEELQSKFKIYVLDLPGFGSSFIEKPLDVVDNANMLKEFCIKLNIKKPLVLAHSYGGRIAIKFANIFDIEKLILVGVPGIKPKLSMKKRISIIRYKLLKKMGITLNVGSDDYKNATPTLKKMLVMAVNLNLEEDLKSIMCPTLLIYGEKDFVTPVKMAQRMNELITNSGLVVIPSTGHFCYLENKRYFLIVVNKFLGDAHDNSN